MWGSDAIIIYSRVDEVDPALIKSIKAADFVVAQACYADALTDKADVVLPSTIWAEKSCTTTNGEGKVTTLKAAVQVPAGVKQDEDILKALAAKLG